MAVSSRLLSALFAAYLLAGCATAPPEPAAAAGERGLWLGPIHLCRDTVEAASVTADIAGMPAVTFILKPEAGAQLALETRRQIGRPPPIRLDGRTISEPVVQEPILGGMAQFSGPAEGNEWIARAAMEPC